MKPTRNTPFRRVLSLFLLLLILTIPVLYFAGCSGSSRETTNDPGKITGKISISGAFALYPLTVKWAEAFMQQHPGVIIDISAGGAGKGMVDVLSGMVDLAMFSREVTEMETSKGAWKLAVARDAVFPVLNVHNPNYIETMRKGLTKEQLQEVFLGNIQEWGSLLGNGSQEKLHVYTRSDACGAAAMWAAYFGLEQENLKGTGVFGDPGIADAVRKDYLGIGYNNLAFLYDLKTRQSVTGLAVVPIDFNGNRIIDPEEKLYGSLDDVMNFIQSGAYPSPPARSLYLISKGVPASPAVVAFLQFILTDGQHLVPEAGYVCMDSVTIASGKSSFLKPSESEGAINR